VVKGGGIAVEVKQGVVTLSGTVELQVQIEKATKIAKKVKGVKEVINHLEIRNKKRGQMNRCARTCLAAALFSLLASAQDFSEITFIKLADGYRFTEGPAWSKMAS